MLQQRWGNFNTGGFNNQNASQPRAGAVADEKKLHYLFSTASECDSFREMHLSVVQQRVRIANWKSAFCGHMAHATTVSLYWEFQVELRYSSWAACKNMNTCLRPRPGNVEETEIQKSRQTYGGRYRIWSRRRTETRPQKRDDRTQQDDLYKTIQNYMNRTTWRERVPMHLHDIAQKVHWDGGQKLLCGCTMEECWSVRLQKCNRVKRNDQENQELADAPTVLTDPAQKWKNMLSFGMYLNKKLQTSAKFANFWKFNRMVL